MPLKHHEEPARHNEEAAKHHKTASKNARYENRIDLLTDESNL
jgi:hypothetical protein